MEGAEVGAGNVSSKGITTAPWCTGMPGMPVEVPSRIMALLQAAGST